MDSSASRSRKLLPLRWRVVIYLFAWLLLLIVVLQNMEPTRIDVLFWSFGEVPKLVLVVASMVVGVFLWEVGRLLSSRSRRSADH